MKLPLALLARALALTWAGFWMLFFIAESWAWHTPVRGALPWAGAGMLFVFLAFVPWRWERTGGLLLVVVGLSAGAAYAIWPPPRLPVASRVLTTVVLSGPPLAAGIFFLIHRRAAMARAANPAGSSSRPCRSSKAKEGHSP
jgi:hypothetical protein